MINLLNTSKTKVFFLAISNNVSYVPGRDDDDDYDDEESSKKDYHG